MKHGCRILTILASDGPIAFDDKDIRLKALSEQESNESYRQTMTTMGFGKKKRLGRLGSGWSGRLSAR